MTKPTLPPIRWGVISTANIGRAAVIPAIHASSNGELVAVASREKERAAEFASANGIPRSCGTYQALLDDPGIDAVYIPLPNSMHREWTVRAVEAGKHVLCEKPLGLTEQECLEMDAAATEAGVYLMEAFMYRFHPRTQHAVAMVRDHAVGPVRTIRSSFTFRLRGRDNIRLLPEFGGGSLMDVGCYCVNITRTLAGEEPVEVFAFAEIGDTGVDETMAGTLRFENGLLAQFDCALTMERREAYQVAGSDGHFDVDRAFLPGTDEAAIRQFEGSTESAVHRFDGVDEYRLMVEHFGDCITGNSPPRYTAREAAANMRVIEALYRSAGSGRPETL